MCDMDYWYWQILELTENEDISVCKDLYRNGIFGDIVGSSTGFSAT